MHILFPLDQVLLWTPPDPESRLRLLDSWRAVMTSHLDACGRSLLARMPKEPLFIMSLSLNLVNTILSRLSLRQETGVIVVMVHRLDCPLHSYVFVYVCTTIYFLLREILSLFLVLRCTFSPVMMSSWTTSFFTFFCNHVFIPSLSSSPPSLSVPCFVDLDTKNVII